MRRNYRRKLSATIYHHAKNVGIIGILAYPKIYLMRPLMTFEVIIHMSKKIVFILSRHSKSESDLGMYIVYKRILKGL